MVKTAKKFDIKAILKSNVVKVYLVMILMYIVICCIKPGYFSWTYMMGQLVLGAFLGITAMGQTTVILTGGIDLSVAWMMNLSACMLTQITSKAGPAQAIIFILLTGVFVGFFNGLGVSLLKIPPMIMTLAMNLILRSVTLVYCKGTPKGSVPDFLAFLGKGRFLNIRAMIFVWAILAIIILLVLKKTVFGRSIYAVGNNASASDLSGIKSGVVLTGAYTLSALFAAISGIMLVSMTSLAYLGMGDAYQMDSVAAVVIGGTAITGGKGGYAGTIAGTMIMMFIEALLVALNMPGAGKQIVNGVVIIAVLLMYARGKSVRV
ncbi:MAG: ABC transporter permease [Oscillospiraceae bacterium]